jgi:inner membrane protein
MDSISQAALGAAIGHALLGEKLGKKASVLGAIVATVPDLDVILYAFYSPLEMLSIHRGFSHSIVFSVAGAFILTFLIARFRWAKSVDNRRVLLFSWLCLITHMLLDFFTAYGTQLYLPFSNERLGLDSINVVDPVYTLPLLIGLGVSLWKRRVFPNKLGLLISSLYLFTTLGLKHTVVNTIVTANLNESQIEYEELMTIPVGMASLNWYAVAKNADTVYLKKFSLLDSGQNEFVSFPINEELLNEVDSELAEEMRWFAKGFYTVMEGDSKLRFFNLQVDMRGIVDDGIQPAPTAGFFELSKDADGNWHFGSGTVLPK